MFKKCEKCGNTFRCYSSEQCWCSQLKAVNTQKLEKLSDCICEQCLERLSSTTP